MLDLPWHLNQCCRPQPHTQTCTPARLWTHEREAHWSFHRADVSFSNTHKNCFFFTLTYELSTRVSAVNSESEPPGREHSSWWKSSRLQRHSPLLKLETVCLSGSPLLCEAALTVFYNCLLWRNKCMCGHVISQETYRIIWVCCQQKNSSAENCRKIRKRQSALTEQNNKDHQ